MKDARRAASFQGPVLAFFGLVFLVAVLRNGWRVVARNDRRTGAEPNG